MDEPTIRKVAPPFSHVSVGWVGPIKEYIFRERKSGKYVIIFRSKSIKDIGFPTTLNVPLHTVHQL